MTERNNTLKLSLERLQQDSAAQNAAFVGASVDFEQKLAKQESATDRLVKSQEQRASAAELVVKATEREFLRAKESILDLETQLDDIKKAWQAATDKDETRDESPELERLQARLGELENEKRALLEKESCLVDRYKEGHLVNYSVDCL